MIYFPKITEFNKDNICVVHVPRNPTPEFYEEVYSKGVLKKEELEIGKYYYGKCRNAKVAMWDGNVFWYMRTKFSYTYKEDINHLQDDNGYDLFVPLEEVTPKDHEKIKGNDLFTKEE